MKLPPVIRFYRHKVCYLLAWLPYIAIYELVGRYPVFTPRVLEFSALDRVIPFVPQALPIYVAYLPFYWWTVSRSEDDLAANRVFYATHFQLALSLMVFVLYPVAMPRELFYGANSYGWVDAFWRWFDAPNNCLPSLHVSNCLMLIQFNWPRRGRGVHTVAALAIIASTVLVKQHYVVDLAAAAVVYLLSRAFLARLEIAGPSDELLARSRQGEGDVVAETGSR